MKMVKATQSKTRGRPSAASSEQLLRYEWLWIETLCGLRDGVYGAEGETAGSSGMLMKSDEKGREKIDIIVPGEAPRTLLQPKFTTTPEELRDWHNRTGKERSAFTQARLTGRVKHSVLIPAERHLWNALKRAQTAAQVRRIVSQSKEWLRPRLEFPDGSYMEQWPFRRALYTRAAEFCKSKIARRYPRRDKRESGDYRRIEYLARVLAGLTLGISPSTAVERLRKMKHAEQCRCWRCTCKIRPRYQRTLAQFLGSNAVSTEENRRTGRRT
jgi:hypothetical protein